jgi:beta-lactam-binding protein with PASTA domain/tRNA A-37 threonylcarbamoyl transferase component Bud32
MATVTESIGRVLAGRYRIESVLGTGASAHVFAAWDVTLRRRVAIKLLHPALATDGAFLNRFRSEAQSAAALTHPHVLSVFDWGEDDSGPFLVLEFLGGGSLRDLLDAGALLSLSQAVSVGMQAAEGLAYAHGRGFVHRDIKPANLLFDEEARLRIADFGLARALAEAALTEPAGATVGTARYAAPEQALGHKVDGRADVYSLALVLYEAVTGVVPFTADTTISTLMARVGSPLPGHEALGPIAPLLEEAANPDPDQRIDAAHLARSLSDLASELPAPAAMPLAGASSERSANGRTQGSDHAGRGRGDARSGASSAVDDLDRTEHGALIGDDDDNGSEPYRLLAVASAVGVADGTDDDLDSNLAGESAGGVAKTRAARKAARRAAKTIAKRQGSHGGLAAGAPQVFRARWLTWKKALVALVAAAVVAGAALAVVETKVFVPNHRVPTLTGLSFAQAEAKLHPDHFTLRTSGHRYSTTVASGDVVSESPVPGTLLKEGRTVSVVLSSGPPPVGVPSLSSVTSGDCPAATSALAASHLRADCLYEHSTEVQQGGVVDWQPKGRAPEFSTVKVWISQGPPIETIPPLDGLTCAAATSALQNVGLKSNCVNTYTTTGTQVGLVIPGDWSPSTSAPEGSTVTIHISQGPPLVQVPAIGPGMTLPQMEAALVAIGLQPGQNFGPLRGTVFATNPSYPSSVPEGTSVDIYTR